MKKRKTMVYVFFPVVFVACLYVVFYSRIATKPTDAGFWFIFALGMSLGVSLTRFIQLLKSGENEK
jgi:hypothetical protein